MPTKCTPRTTARICRKLRAVGILKLAAFTLGLPPTTMTDWRKRGKRAVALAEAGQPVPKAERRYLEFYLRTQEALGKNAGTRLEAIAGSKDWRAHQYLLQVSGLKQFFKEDPKEVKVNAKQEVEVSGQVDVQVDYRRGLEFLTYEELLELDEKWARCEELFAKARSLAEAPPQAVPMTQALPAPSPHAREVPRVQESHPEARPGACTCPADRLSQLGDGH